MSSDVKINELLCSAMSYLDMALEESLMFNREHKDSYEIGVLGRSIGLLREFQKPILERNPELRPAPPWAGEPEPCLTNEEYQLISGLSQEVIQELDKALLSNVTSSFQKVAKIVGMTMNNASTNLQGIPDIFYAQRIEKLAVSGVLEYEGNLKFMRFCEVRIIVAKDEEK